MNTVQSASIGQDKVQSLIRNQRPELEKDKEVSKNDAAIQTNNIKKDRNSSSPDLNAENGKDKNNDKLEVNEYLKIVSRLENKLNLDELNDEDLNKISASLEEKILSLSSVQKNRLKNLEFFKEHGIENINDLKNTLFELFKNVDEREPLFEFLKSPEFMNILLNESDKPMTYSPMGPQMAGNVVNKSV